MTPTTRLLTADDIPEAVALGREAFGHPPPGTPLPAPETWPMAGRHTWGTFDGDRLLAKVVGREYHSWWGGVAVPTNGIAGVAVTAEARGRGLLDELFRVVLAEGRDRGEVLSTLFPTAPGIYRRFGYELVASYDTVELVTAALAGARGGEGITVRRATAADFDGVRRVYDTWASAQNGPLTRRGVSFEATAEDFVAAFTGVTLALDERGEVVGYLSWTRGPGYDGNAAIEVADLVAVDGRAHPALWRVLGSFSTVSGRVRIDTSGQDVARLSLPGLRWRVVTSHPYMLRVDDVCGAVSAVRPRGSASFRVAGDLLGTMDGGYTVVDGECRPVVDAGGPTYTPRGLALWYAGVQTCANLRLAGLLTGPDGDDDVLDAMLERRPLHIRDYF